MLKIALVAAMLARGHHLWLLAIPAVARAAASALSATLPYAREQGTGAALIGGGQRAERLAVALATAIVVALACARLRGLLAIAAAALVALVVGRSPSAASAASPATCWARRSSSPSAPRWSRSSPGAEPYGCVRSVRSVPPSSASQRSRKRA